MISVQSWSGDVARGSIGVVTFRVASDRPLVRLEIDLLGDGLPAPTVLAGDDLRPVLALAFQPPAVGTFSLQVRARDAAGCEGSTGLRRDVVVH